MKERIIELLRELKSIEKPESCSDLIGDGILDSFDIVTLVADMEEEFSIIISPREITPENFATVDALCALVERRLTDNA